MHISKEDNLTLEDLGIVQQPEIIPNIKQNINIADLEDDSDGDKYFEKQLESNPVSFQTPSPRDYSSLARKCREPEGSD